MDGPQTSTYYAHRDTFSFDGTAKFTFNDTSTRSSKNDQEYVIRSFDDTKENSAGDIVEIPTHSDGTINLSETTKYVLDVWVKGYENGIHAYQTITVNIPTLTLEDNYTGSYYVGTSRDIDAKVTAVFGDTSRELLSSEYRLSQSAINPTTTDPIAVTATWVIDGEDAMTSNELTINPILSTRALSELVVDPVTFPAGSSFVLPEESIMLAGTENGDSFVEYLEQGKVTFEDAQGNVLDKDTRLTSKNAGSVTARYSEGSGEGKEVSATFELTISDAVVETYTPKVIGNTASKASSIEVGDIVYLVCEDQKNQFNGVSSNLGQCAEYSDTINVETYPLEVVSGTQSGTYAFKMADGSYIAATSSNKLPVSGTVDDNSSWNVTINASGDADILNCGQPTRRILFNITSPRYCAYAKDMGETGYSNVQLYKRDITAQVGDPVSYLKSVIDAYRLNNTTEENSICASSGIYSSPEWAKAKQTYLNLTEAEKTSLNVKDYFGDGSTYVETFEMLIANDPANKAASFFANKKNPTSSIALAASASLGFLAFGSFFLIRKKNERN